MPAGEVTELLAAIREGSEEAQEALMQLVYDDLHARATALMKRESSHHTLQATALVHEAYLVLVRQDRVTWQNRAQFFATSAQLMRRILVDHARSRHRDKRGRGWVRIALSEDAALSPGRDEDVLALEEALERLSELDPRQAQIVVLRFYGGLTVQEVAWTLDLSKRTIEGEWTMAKAWLRRELLESPDRG